MRYAWVVLLAGLAAQLAAADDVRYYEDNGVTYRETRQKVNRPINETALVDQQRTVYREKLDTELVDQVRTYQIPVTEYRREAYWANRFAIFRQPYLAERVVPTRRLETRTETVKVPVTRRQLVPETTTVRVPVTTQRMVQDEIISRVVVGTRPAAAPATAIAARPATGSSSTAPMNVPPTAIGGISKMGQEPPRVGQNYQWRPSTTLR